MQPRVPQHARASSKTAETLTACNRARREGMGKEASLDLFFFRVCLSRAPPASPPPYAPRVVGRGGGVVPNLMC